MRRKPFETAKRFFCFVICHKSITFASVFKPNVAMGNYTKEEIFCPETIEKLKEHYKAILELLGEDVSREGLLKTPERVAKAMSFLTQGYDQNPRDILLSARFKEDYRHMVIVKDIELYSLCEHHMLPFYGKG